MSAVIYIDDEPLLCRAVTTILRSRGFEVVTFVDPGEALAHIAAHGAALVICDYRMPQMSGLEVRKRLALDVPFYLVSGELDVPPADGVTAVLNKPYPIERLVALVERHVPVTP